MKSMIFGITGQDGSFLAEQLLEKGHEVHGVIRRSSNFNTQRINHIYDKIKLYYGDLSSSNSIYKLIHQIEPDFVYNLGAMSHVRVSFDDPEYTMDVTATGVVRILEAIRDLRDKVGKSARYYQASSSEMFGSAPPPQNESTTFHPRSPYGCAKVAAYHLTVNYREAYGIHACNGILYNHECLTYQMPVIIRQNDLIDIMQIGDLSNFSVKGKNKQTSDADFEVWDSNKFVRVTHITASKYNGTVRKVSSRMGVLETTPEHIWFDDNGNEVKCGNLQVGRKLEKSLLPSGTEITACVEEFAWLLGLMCADGSVTSNNAKIINKNRSLLEKAAKYWNKISGGTVRYGMQKSGFTGRRDIFNITLNDDPILIAWIEKNIYTPGSKDEKKYKKIPKVILNSNKDVIKAFIDGYCAGDGTTSLPRADYDFQYYTTNSAILALGIRFCINILYNNIDVTYNIYGKNNHIYKGFVSSPKSITGELGDSGKDFKRDQQEITKIHETNINGWVFDLATDSHKFTAGTGLIRVHNSERRGETFVTRKITKAVARIKLKKQDKLFLGNLDAKRDWGYAPDYVRCMQKIIEHNLPDDFVVATGESHTVKDFVESAFGQLDLDWSKYVEINQKYFRPSEVDHLLGDASKAKKVLGWEPQYKFHDLVKIMVEYDFRKESK